MTDRSHGDTNAADESTQTTSGAPQGHPTEFTPEHAPQRRVQYERCVDAAGWVDPAAEPTTEELPATDGGSGLADCRYGERDD